jgi:glycine/D-amino acid oxidase-like deaminating enzyme
VGILCRFKFIKMDLHSGYPFWLVKNGLPFDYPKLQQAAKADVVILGSGISGALMAYQLVEAGVSCMLVDGRTVGLGSTCASTALLQYEIDTPLCYLINKVGEANAVKSYKLCEEAIFKLKKIADKIGFRDVELKQSLYYAAYKKHLPFLKDEFEIRRQHGFDVDWLDAPALKKQFNIDAPAAILSASGGQTNAYCFGHALLQYVHKNGALVYDRTPVQKIVHHKNGVTLTAKNGCVIQAKTLVYATGYEAVNFIDKKIVDLQCTYACVSEQANESLPHFVSDALIWYMRSTNDKRILIGGRDEKFSSPAKRDRLLHAKTKQLVRDFNNLFPEIDFKPEFSWAGTFGATKDGLPFIGNYKQLPHSLFALGFGGNGITFSQIAAEILTAHITGRKNKKEAIFSFDRV